MNKYENGKIYKITCDKTDKIYIGATILKLNLRFNRHKTDYKNFKSGKDKKHTNSTLIFDASDNIYDTKIILIEKFPCNSKEELQKREFEIITNTKNCVNCYNGKWVYDKKYQKEHKKEYSENYRKVNKNKIKEYNKKYSKEYNKVNKNKIKEYNKEYSKKHRQANKQIISEKRKIKITCECGSTLRKDVYLRHCKSKKHQKYLNNLNTF